MTPEKEKEAGELIGKFITGFVEVMEENERKYIAEMVESMKAQADIIRRARKDGVIIPEIMDKIKVAYEEATK